MRTTFLAFLSVLAGLAGLPLQVQGATGLSHEWTVAWATSLQAIPPLAAPPPLYRAPDVAGRAVRQIIVPTLGGASARLHLSNRYASEPLAITGASLVRAADNGKADKGRPVALTFNGKPGVTLAPGQEIDSDPAVIEVVRHASYAVTLEMGPKQRMQAWHRTAGQVNYVRGFERSGQGVSKPQDVRFTHTAWMTSLSVPGQGRSSVVAIGDSITDGLLSTLNANRRWPDAYSRRLAPEAGIGVANAGISGNRLLSDSPCYGVKLVDRFKYDALDLPGVRAAVVLIGINDINFAIMPPRRGLDCDFPHTQVTAADLIAGYRRIVAEARAHGVRVWGGTITPASLAAPQESIRAETNRWIRQPGNFDGVIDFDAALRDPARPTHLRRDYDSGDNVHPSDAGYAAMARAVPLSLTRGDLPHP